VISWVGRALFSGADPGLCEAPQGSVELGPELALLVERLRAAVEAVIRRCWSGSNVGGGWTARGRLR